MLMITTKLLWGLGENNASAIQYFDSNCCCTCFVQIVKGVSRWRHLNTQVNTKIALFRAGFLANVFYTRILTYYNQLSKLAQTKTSTVTNCLNRIVLM